MSVLLKTLPIFTVRSLHHGILLFVVFGWLFPQHEILIAHMLAIPLVILQWKLNQGHCVLTVLENRLLAKSEQKESEGFVKNLLSRAFHIELTDEQLMQLMYVVMGVSFFISAVKFFIV